MYDFADAGKTNPIKPNFKRAQILLPPQVATGDLVRVHVIFVGKNPLLLLTGLQGWFLGTVDSRFRGNDSGVVGVINGETIANGPKNLPTILTGTHLVKILYIVIGSLWRMDYNHHSGKRRRAGLAPLEICTKTTPVAAGELLLTRRVRKGVTAV